MINKVIKLREDFEPNPTLTAYLLDDLGIPERKRPAVVVCPGGGYACCAPYEGEPIAMQYTAKGFQTFVVNYSVAPYKYPCALEDVTKAIRIIRENAEEWNVDPDAIAVLGFSAGAHLAGSVGMFWNSDPVKTEDKSNRPNAVIMCYPVVTSGEFAHRGSFENLCGDDEELIKKMSLENQVSEDTPPFFIWHTQTDNAVPVENSLMLAAALQKGKVPFELHIYPVGAHGLALANEVTGHKDGFSKNVTSWMELSINWLKETFNKE